MRVTVHAVGIFVCCVFLAISYFDPSKEPFIIHVIKGLIYSAPAQYNADVARVSGVDRNN